MSLSRAVRTFLMLFFALHGYCCSQEVVMQPVLQNANPNREIRAKQWVRGLIQQELNAVSVICKPDAEQAQKLVDMAESQWKPKLVTLVKAYSDAVNRQTVDFESRVERLMAIWINECLDESRAKKWSEELEDRAVFRRRLVIGKMVLDAEKKFGLTYQQMNEVTDLLKERYRESWWQLYRQGTTPETKFVWISRVLSESQQTLGNDRTNANRIESFTSAGSVDLPSKKLNERFELGDKKSDSIIELDTRDAEGAPENGKRQNGNDGVLLPLIEIPMIFGR
jgi:hypothetical protein